MSQFPLNNTVPTPLKVRQLLVSSFKVTYVSPNRQVLVAMNHRTRQLFGLQLLVLPPPTVVEGGCFWSPPAGYTPPCTIATVSTAISLTASSCSCPTLAPCAIVFTTQSCTQQMSLICVGSTTHTVPPAFQPPWATSNITVQPERYSQPIDLNAAAQPQTAVNEITVVS